MKRAGSRSAELLRCKSRQELLGLFLHVLLHLQKHVVAQRRQRSGQGRRNHSALQIHQRLHIFFQISAHETLHGVAIKADDVLQNRGCEHRGSASLLLQNDLQQNTSADVFGGFGVQHRKRLAIHNELLDLSQGDIRGGSGVVQAAVGVFLDHPLRQRPARFRLDGIRWWYKLGFWHGRGSRAAARRI